MPATAGWRNQTNFNVSLESFKESDLDGNESTVSNVSYMLSSKILHKVYQESSSSSLNAEKKYSRLFLILNEKAKKAITKLNVAMGFGKNLAGKKHRFFIGVSYASGRVDEGKSATTSKRQCKEGVERTTTYGHTYCREWELKTDEGDSDTVNVQESSLGLGISFNQWELLYVSSGVQQTSTTDVEIFLANTSKNYRYLGNTWVEKYYGFSIKSTRPDVPKFILEWLYIQSPSSTKEATFDNSISTSTTRVVTNEHDKYEVHIRKMKFSPTNLNNWVFSYI